MIVYFFYNGIDGESGTWAVSSKGKLRKKVPELLPAC